MKHFDKEELTRALNNDRNTSIVEWDHASIMKAKNDILQKLQLSPEGIKALHKKLDGYRYIDKVGDFVIGNYIRWINLEKCSASGEICLVNGAYICDLVPNSRGTTGLLCRTHYRRMCHVNLDVCLVFQKINPQENVILSVLNYINKGAAKDSSKNSKSSTAAAPINETKNEIIAEEGEHT